MKVSRPDSTIAGSAAAPRGWLRWLGVIFALLFPALITWLFFVLAKDYSHNTQRTVYSVVKIIQFAFPAVWTVLALREPLRTSRPTPSGLLLGAAFGAVVVAAGLAAYAFALDDLPVFAAASELI